MKKLLEIAQKFSRRKFVDDVLTLQFATALTLGINFLTSIFLARYLKPVSYGTYALIFSLLASTRLGTQIGLNNLTVKEVAAASGGQERQKLAHYLAFFLKTGVLLHVLVALGGYLLLPTLAGLMFQKPQLGVTARPLMWLIILGMLYGTGASLIEGFRQMRRLAVLENGAALLRAGLIIGVLLAGGNLTSVIYATIAAYALSVFLSFYLLATLPPACKALLPTLAELWSLLKTTPFTAYLSKGIFIGLYSAVSRLLNYLPLFLLGRYVAVEMAGYYQVAFKIVSVPLLAYAAIGRSLLPKLSQLSGKKDYALLRSNFWQATGWSTLLSLGFTLAFVLTAPLLLRVYGKDYRFALPLVYWLAIDVSLSGLDIGVLPLFVALDKTRTAVTLRLLLAGLTFPVGIYLVQSYGGAGAAGYYSLSQVTANLACLGYAYFALAAHNVSEETRL